jgi:hypothetical protein
MQAQAAEYSRYAGPFRCLLLRGDRQVLTFEV